MNAATLKKYQQMPLDWKIALSQARIIAWYEAWEGQVYVSFSGGKDSTVLLHLVRSIYPEVPAVFANTGLEYPEIRKFVKSVDNVVWVRPAMPFKEVIKKYGYPVISKETAQKLSEMRTTKSKKLFIKRYLGDQNKAKSGKIPEKYRFMLSAPFNISKKCCDVLKKAPFKNYEKETSQKSFIGTMAADSSFRKQHIIRNGCNAFDQKRPISRPLATWFEDDIWTFIKREQLQYSNIYDKGYTRTGCMFCMFGVHLEKEPNRFQLMKETHPKHWEYCLNRLGIKQVLDFIGVPYE